MSNQTPRAAALALLLAVALAGGCHDYRAMSTRIASLDRHTFVSEVYRPLTVSVVEAYSGQVLYTRAIPVHNALIVDLDRAGEFEWTGVSGLPPSKMEWYLYGPDRGQPIESGAVELPRRPVKMVVDVRPVPEYPPQRMVAPPPPPPPPPAAARPTPSAAPAAPRATTRPGAAAPLRSDPPLPAPPPSGAPPAAPGVSNLGWPPPATAPAPR